MHHRFLWPSEIERLIEEERFVEVEEVDEMIIHQLKHFGYVLAKVEAEKCDKMPFDGFVWSRTTTQNGKTTFRHQPKYKKIDLFGEMYQSVRCLELNDGKILKQIIEYGKWRLFFYSSNSEDLEIPDFNSNRRLKRSEIQKLKKEVIPHRTVNGAQKAAVSLGMNVTKRQIRNAARGLKEAVKGKTGQMVQTTNQQAEKIKDPEYCSGH
ncbi:unnamed protein product [Caenorhabditis nigoni]